MQSVENMLEFRSSYRARHRHDVTLSSAKHQLIVLVVEIFGCRVVAVYKSRISLLLLSSSPDRGDPQVGGHFREWKHRDLKYRSFW
jgi:hypothetical protein